MRVTRASLDAKLGASMSSVTKMYGSKFAISNLSLDFARNQVSCLLGRNGAGKSTLIKLLTGQTVQTTGQVLLAGEHNVGVCWQDNILIPKLTAREHLELYAQLKLDASAKGQDGSMEHVTAEQEVRRTLKSLNFGKHEDYFAYQLSGGYRRRLCVAIAFIGSPSVVILDEPCNGVDAKARKDIWQLIEQLRQGRAVIFATHFLDEAKYLSDALFVMRQVRRFTSMLFSNSLSLSLCSLLTGSHCGATQSRLAATSQHLGLQRRDALHRSEYLGRGGATLAAAAHRQPRAAWPATSAVDHQRQIRG